MQEMKVKILRAFTDHARRVTKVGEIVSLPKMFAQEMIAANKAERVDEPAAPAVTASQPAAREPAKKEEAKHVR